MLPIPKLPPIVYKIIFILGGTALLTSWVKWSCNVSRHNSDLIAQIETMQNNNLVEVKTPGGLAEQNQVLKESLPDSTLIKAVKELGVKLKNVTEYSRSVASVRERIIVHYRDSIATDSVHYTIFNYSNGYLNLRGINDTINFSYRDTLSQVVFYGKRKHRWNPFSKRVLLQRVALKNPKARVIYSTEIHIEK